VLLATPQVVFADAPTSTPAPAAATATAPAIETHVSDMPLRAPRDMQPSTSAAPSSEAIDYTTPRLEVAGAPLIGGNSDIGFEFGAVATVTRFADGVVPYRWNSDVVLAASLKGGPGGAEIAQQNYLWQLDVPDLVPKRVRFTITSSYQRTIDYGYFGTSNASSSAAASSANGRYFQFDLREALLRSLTRVTLYGPYMLLVAANLRYVDAVAYADSRLSEDAAAGSIRGLRALGHTSLAVGLGYDTRDNEFFPRRGAVHRVGVKATYSLPASADVRYLSVGAVLAGYLPIGGPFVLAARGLVDAQLGNVPFYDLALGGIFQVDELPGGPTGVRGVPVGRYRGPLKLVSNVELRALLYRFHLLGAEFHLGGDVFADCGRAFRDYHFGHNADDTGLGLKWGAGGGLYLQWGQAAVFRAEAAYSPDATANRGFPLGIYVAEGVMF